MHFEKDGIESIIATIYNNHVETVIYTSEIRGNTAVLSSISTVFLQNHTNSHEFRAESA